MINVEILPLTKFRTFQAFCPYGVRWLSLGKFVERMFELREKVLSFLRAQNATLALLVANEI